MMLMHVNFCVLLAEQGMMVTTITCRRFKYEGEVCRDATGALASRPGAFYRHKRRVTDSLLPINTC